MPSQSVNLHFERMVSMADGMAAGATAINVTL